MHWKRKKNFLQATCHWWMTKSCSPKYNAGLSDEKWGPVHCNVTICWRTNTTRMAEVKLGLWCSVVSIFHALSQFSRACLTLLDSHQCVRVCDRGICGGGTYEDKCYSNLSKTSFVRVHVLPLLSCRLNVHVSICLCAQLTANTWMRWIQKIIQIHGMMH